MKNKQVGFRHELKFLISEQKKEELCNIFNCIMQLDPHVKEAEYKVRSLYFDDIHNSAYEDKVAGINHRKKYRIRIYNMEGMIHLECKQKENQYIKKESVLLTQGELDQIMSHDYSFLLQRKEELCKEFYMQIMTCHLQPRVIVDYDRKPYIYPYGTVRITFDSNIRAGFESLELFDSGIPVFEVLDPGMLIMEVKYTEFLPQIIQCLLPKQGCAYVAASKYTLCIEAKNKFQYSN